MEPAHHRPADGPGAEGFYFADDWGSKTSLFFSLETWRKLIKPRLAACYGRVKEKGGIVGQHSDGNILAVIPDLIEIGLDVLNPIQPSVYDPDFVKKEYGKRITLYGGIDVETTLPFGSPAEVAEKSECVPAPWKAAEATSCRARTRS